MLLNLKTYFNCYHLYHWIYYCMIFYCFYIKQILRSARIFKHFEKILNVEKIENFRAKNDQKASWTSLVASIDEQLYTALVCARKHTLAASSPCLEHQWPNIAIILWRNFTQTYMTLQSVYLVSKVPAERTKLLSLRFLSSTRCTNWTRFLRSPPAYCLWRARERRQRWRPTTNCTSLSATTRSRKKLPIAISKSHPDLTRTKILIFN